MKRQAEGSEGDGGRAGTQASATAAAQLAAQPGPYARALPFDHISLPGALALVLAMALLVCCGGNETASPADTSAVDATANDGGTDSGGGASDSQGGAEDGDDTAGDTAGDTAADGGDSDNDGSSDADSATGADAPDDGTDNSGESCPGAPGCPCDEAEGCVPDDDSCTQDPTCLDGFCTAPEPANCDDSNACTVDGCVAATGCTHTPLPGKTPFELACEDGDFCTQGDACQNGTCKAGPALPCNDGNACTDDSCDVGLGCTFAHNTAVCLDENDCIAASVCDLGGCQGGKIKPCSDGNACTYDRCSPETGCLTPPWPKVADCPANASHGGRCYFAVDHAEAVTWTTARAACQQKGGMLATFASRPAEERARAVAKAACGEVSFWVGLDDRIRNNVWRWSDGTGLGWQNWNGGEPNNSGGEDVVEATFGGGWNDLGSAQKRDCTVCMATLAVPCSLGNCGPAGTCEGGSCALPGAATGTGSGGAKPQECDDANACTVDACSKSGCGATALPDGVSCTADGGTCKSGLCQLPAPVAGKAPASCQAIADANAKAPSGVYVLAGSAGATWSTHCLFEAQANLKVVGWTQVLRVDGEDAAFAYDGKGWTETTALGEGAPGPAGKSLRLPGYASLPLQTARIAFFDDGKTRWLSVPLVGASLHAVLNGKAATITELGAPAWQSLLAKPALQPSCHKEGALPNHGAGGQKLRLGILGNNENDCATPDSWIGLGGQPDACGKAGIVAGNVACYGANAKTAVTASVYVR